MITMRSSTLALLKRFRKAGGTVVFAGPCPDHIDAVPSSDATAFAECCSTTTTARLSRALGASSRRVSIVDSRGKQITPALYCLREDDDAHYLFVCNTGHNEFGKRDSDPMVCDRKLRFDNVTIEVKGDGAGAVLELDPGTGDVFGASAGKTKSGWQIATSLTTIGSRLFVLNKKKGQGKHTGRKTLKQVRKQTLAAKSWDIRLSDRNCLVLDRPRHKIGDGPWQNAEEILRIDAMVRESLGIAPRGGQMVQPWARSKPKDVKSTTVALQYSFDVESIAGGPMALAIEEPGTFTIDINGAKVSMDAESGWWVDRSLRTVPVDPSMLRIGKNKLTLVCDYSEQHPGLEIVYLLGRFGTALNGTKLSLTPEPTTLKLGDWVKQGLSFYGGSVAYDREMRPKLKKDERLFVRVPDYRGTAVRISVDGKVAGITAWDPNEVDVTDLLTGDKCTLSIEVIGHRRNSHGPHHTGTKWPRWTGPSQYISDDWIDGYQLVPCGLMKAPELVVKR